MRHDNRNCPLPRQFPTPMLDAGRMSQIQPEYLYDPHKWILRRASHPELRTPLEALGLVRGDYRRYLGLPPSLRRNPRFLPTAETRPTVQPLLIQA